MAQDIDRNRLIVPFLDSSVRAFFEIEECDPQSIEESSAPVKTAHQVHGIEGVYTDHEEPKEADWLWTHHKHTPVGVFVADCTAILISGRNAGGNFVASVHAGWRGSALGIIEEAVRKLNPLGKWKAWLSPSICQDHFEVGGDVLIAFGSSIEGYLKEGRPGCYLFDLKAWQRDELQRYGGEVVMSSLCSWEQPEFYSYRQGKAMGKRHLAWIEMR